jgi:hypothetical protein
MVSTDVEILASRVGTAREQLLCCAIGTFEKHVAAVGKLSTNTNDTIILNQLPILL